MDRITKKLVETVNNIVNSTEKTFLTEQDGLQQLSGQQQKNETVNKLTANKRGVGTQRLGAPVYDQSTGGVVRYTSTGAQYNTIADAPFSRGTQIAKDFMNQINAAAGEMATQAQAQPSSGRQPVYPGSTKSIVAGLSEPPPPTQGSVTSAPPAAAKPEKYSGPYSQRAPQADDPVAPTGKYFYPGTFVGREMTPDEVAAQTPKPKPQAAAPQAAARLPLITTGRNERAEYFNSAGTDKDVITRRAMDEDEAVARVVPGSQSWGQLSPQAQERIRERYRSGASGLSVRFKDGKFDEPGYGDQGKYGDIVRALNTPSARTQASATPQAAAPQAAAPQAAAAEPQEPSYGERVRAAFKQNKDEGGMGWVPPQAIGSTDADRERWSKLARESGTDIATIRAREINDAVREGKRMKEQQDSQANEARIQGLHARGNRAGMGSLSEFDRIVHVSHMDDSLRRAGIDPDKATDEQLKQHAGAYEADQKKAADDAFAATNRRAQRMRDRGQGGTIVSRSGERINVDELLSADPEEMRADPNKLRNWQRRMEAASRHFTNVEREAEQQYDQRYGR